MSDKVLGFIQTILYLAVVFLWFQGNFPAMKHVGVSVLVPLLPLIAITGWRIRRRFKNAPLPGIFLARTDIVLILILVVVAVSVRIPFLAHNFGLLNADDANAVLAGKHISEGKLAPIYHYGQFYMGTLGYHFHALIFRMFGYSVLGALTVCLLIYLGFIIFQFVFFRELFKSRSFAFVMAIFYCLPIGHLFSVSFHLGTSFPLVLLLGSFSLYLSYLLVYRNRKNVVFLLGFILGLMYWLHPSTIAFSLTAAVPVIRHFKFRLKEYVPIAAGTLVGGFPFILAEVGYGFIPMQSIFSGARRFSLSRDKLEAFARDIIHLLSSETNLLNVGMALLLVLGILAILLFSARRREVEPPTVFIMFTLIFSATYLFSVYGEPGMSEIRYLYPLYIVFPVLLLGVFSRLSPKPRLFISVFVLLAITLFNNAHYTRTSYAHTKAAHAHLKEIISAMEATGERYWVGRFWQAHLLTALSGETIVGWPFDHEDYLPYGLEYLNRGENANFVFFSEVGSYAVEYKEKLSDLETALDRDIERKRHFLNLLEALHIDATVEKISKRAWLIHGLAVPALPYEIERPIPSQIPHVAFAGGTTSQGSLDLAFITTCVPEGVLFRLHAEIPGFSSRIIHLHGGKEEALLRIPHPSKPSFPIQFSLYYWGLKVPGTTQEVIYTLTDEALKSPREEVLLLTGFGPQTPEAETPMLICEKEIRLEINSRKRDNTACRISLYSPIDFTDPFWYGKHHQSARIEVNGIPVKEQRLNPGNNTIEFGLPPLLFSEDRHVLTIQFKYHHLNRRHILWKTAAFFDSIEIIPGR